MTPRTKAASGNVAVLVQDFNTSDFPRLIGGITDGMHGWGVPLLYSARGRIESETVILQELKTKEIDGILVNGMFSALPNPNIPMYQELIDRGVPVVFLLSPYNGLHGSVSVTHDDIGGGAMAVQHLHDRGRKKLCGIFTSDFILGLNRYQGYTEKCRELGIELLSRHTLWLYSRDYQDPELIRARILKLVNGRDGLICQNDYIAHTVIKILTEASIRVPDDLAVVSFDNNYLCNYPPVSITSLDGDPYEIGRVAALKLKHMRDGKKETSVSLPWHLEQRQST